MDDAALEAWVEDTVAPYRGILSPQSLEEMRVVVRATYAAHPVTRQLIAEVSDRVPQQRSGVVADDAAADDDSAALPDASNGGPKR